MKKILLLISILSFGLTLAAPAFALTTAGSAAIMIGDRPPLHLSTTTSEDGFHASAKARLESFLKQKGMELRQNFEHMTDMLKNKWSRFFSHILAKRLMLAIDRLTTIGNRIDSRLSKIASTGKDISAAQQKLAQARAHLAAAKTAVEDLNLMLEGSSTASTSADVREEISPAVKAIKDELNQARQLMVSIVASLANEDNSASSTVH